MPLKELKKLRLTDRDLNFLIETVSPGVSDKGNLIRIIREDEDFQKSKKPLNFIAEHYLKYKRQMLFG